MWPPNARLCGASWPGRSGGVLENFSCRYRGGMGREAHATAGQEASATNACRCCAISSCRSLQVLVFALDQKAGDGLESIGAAAIRFESGKGFFDEPRSVALALFDAVDGRPCGLFRGQVLPCCLAQLR